MSTMIPCGNLLFLLLASLKSILKPAKTKGENSLANYIEQVKVAPHVVVNEIVSIEL